MKRILIIHGPNLNLLGLRQPEIYGTLILDELNRELHEFAEKHDAEIRCFQSNHEGVLIDFIHDHIEWADGIVINPGALTHYSYALRDAIASVGLPAVEVHLSDIHAREDFRRISVIEPVCIGQIAGLGKESYFKGIEILTSHIHGH